jgi:hypothetical protein
MPIIRAPKTIPDRIGSRMGYRIEFRIGYRESNMITPFNYQGGSVQTPGF